jgi:hypothetical protein
VGERETTSSWRKSRTSRLFSRQNSFFGLVHRMCLMFPAGSIWTKERLRHVFAMTEEALVIEALAVAKAEKRRINLSTKGMLKGAAEGFGLDWVKGLCSGDSAVE